MKLPSQRTFLYSKNRVKVYLKPEYHPALRGTDLSNPDFVRKAKELFSSRSRRVRGLPKICSKNSEDAQTWRHFSPLLSMSPHKREDWLKAFLEASLKRKLDGDLVSALGNAELLFWRGKRACPMFVPPSNLGCREGNTEVDLTVFARKAIIFVEAKYNSEIARHTTHCPTRDQIIRNIDVGTHYAWGKDLNFYFVLLTSPNCNKSIELMRYYLENPPEIANRLPHRIDIAKKAAQIANNMGLITWSKLPRV